MKRNFIILLLVMQVQLLSACHFKNHDQDSSAIVHEVRTVDHFKGISASTGINVYISQGSTEHVEVVSSQKTIKDIRTKVEGGILKIYYQHKDGFHWFSMHINRTMKVYVTATQLESISSSSGSDIFGQTHINAPDLQLNASSGSDMRLDVTSTRLNIDVSSGAGAELKGSATNFNGSASSGANIKGLELVTDSSTVSASSGGNVKVTVKKMLKATASSGGDISYKGNPASVSKDKSSGGDVNAE